MLCMPFLLEQRFFATIQSFHLTPLGDFRITYELALPLDYDQSNECKSGRAGSNNKYPKKSFLSYKIVIEQKNSNNTSFDKKGTIITGYLRERKYNSWDSECLKHPSPNAIAWGGLKSTFNAYQKQITKKPLKRSNLDPHQSLNIGLTGKATPRQKTAESNVMAAFAANPNKPVPKAEMNILAKHKAYSTKTKQLYGGLKSKNTKLNKQNVRYNL